MAIAFSDTDIVYRDDIIGTNTASLLADLEAALTAAGWPSDPITGGRKYRLVSPQGPACRVKIWDPGDYDFSLVYIFVQFMSDDETNLGYRHMLAVAPGKVFQIVANQCQMFVSVAGHSDGFTSGNAVAGGIPFSGETMAPNGDCRQEVGEHGTLTDIWWSCGDRQDGPDGAVWPNFRTGYRCRMAWSAGYRGDLLKLDTSVGAFLGNLRLFPVTQCYDVDSHFGDPPEIRYYGGRPLYLDPLIGWGYGTDLNLPARVRAQIWDAVIVSVDHDLDEIEEIDGKTYINYSHSENNDHGQGTHFCSLHLLLTPPTTPDLGNFVY